MGVTLAAMLSGAAERNTLIYGAVIPYFGCLSDYDRAAVIDKKPFPYFCGRVYFYSRKASGKLAYGTCGKIMLLFMKIMSGLMGNYRMKAWIQQKYFRIGPGSRISVSYRTDVILDIINGCFCRW